METPMETHQRILRYIKGTLNLGLFCAYGDEAKLVGYSNSDWGCDQIRGKIQLVMCSILVLHHFLGHPRNKQL
jgi:hypothetical protein